MPDWKLIVEQNAAVVLNTALRVLGNLSDAEDVSQEVFAEAFKKWRLQQPTESTHSWAAILRRMAVCRAIDVLRSAKTIQPIPLETADSTSNSPLHAAIGNEAQQRLRVAIAKLPTRESQVFCLMFFEQQSHHEISQTLDISTTAVTSALSKARSKLELVFREFFTGEIK